jgi:two-component system, NarL family, nitrate/nitrite response regulator NarL
VGVKVYILGTDRAHFSSIRTLLLDTEFEILGQSDTLQDFFRSVAKGVIPELVIVMSSSRHRVDERTEELLNVASSLEEVPVLLAGAVPDPATMESVLKLLSEEVIDGYLLTDYSQDIFITSLNLAMLGGKVVPADFFRVMYAAATSHEGNGDRQPISLSEREVEILKCLVAGETNKEIANALNIAEGTVKVHMKTLLLKIKAVNRTQAAIWAMKHGIGLKS